MRIALKLAFPGISLIVASYALLHSVWLACITFGVTYILLHVLLMLFVRWFISYQMKKFMMEIDSIKEYVEQHKEELCNQTINDFLESEGIEDGK